MRRHDNMTTARKAKSLQHTHTENETKNQDRQYILQSICK